MLHVVCTCKQVTINDAYVYGQEVTGRANRRLGTLLVGSPKDLRFRAFFGVSAEVAVEAWRMMAEPNFLPPNPNFLHYLWALAFMRLYPANDKALSSALGGSDPKTIRKYIWPIIQSIFDLKAVVVSLKFSRPTPLPPLSLEGGGCWK